MIHEEDPSALVQMLARGILAFAYRDDPTRIVPYPAAMQAVLDQVVLWHLTSGTKVPPPVGVPELLHWARETPIDKLPFAADTYQFLASDPLIDRVSGMPTRTCIELASSGNPTGWEQQARAILAELVASGLGGYQQHDFLADRPVVSSRDTLSFQADPRLALTWRTVRHYYQPPADLLVQHKKLHVCPECRLPARAGNDGAVTWCETERCDGLGRLADVHDASDAVVLVESLRAFHVRPARMARELRTVVPGTATATPAASGRFVADLESGPRLVQVLDVFQPSLIEKELTAMLEREGAIVVVPRRNTVHDRRYKYAVEAVLGSSATTVVMTDGEFQDGVRRGFDRIREAADA